MADQPVNLRALRDARNQARDQLAAAFADDLIDSDELDRRLGLLVDATTLEELDTLIADVVDPSSVAVVSPTTSLARVEDIDPVATISAVFGETHRRGNWTPARTNIVKTIIASSEIDLRQAALAQGETVFDVSVFMGELVFIAPPGLRVVSDISVFLASVDEEEDTAEAPSAATIRLTGSVVLGEVQVARRLDGESKRDAKRRRKAERKALKRAARQRALPPG